MTATIGVLPVVTVAAKMSCHPFDLEARCVMAYSLRWVLRVLLFGAVMASLLVLADHPTVATAALANPTRRRTSSGTRVCWMRSAPPFGTRSTATPTG